MISFPISTDFSCWDSHEKQFMSDFIEKYMIPISIFEI